MPIIPFLWETHGDNMKAKLKIDPKKNTIICGDNLKWLKYVPNESVDVCYIDPPYFSNANYQKIWGNGWEVTSFGDMFSGGMNQYIEWMTPRIKEIHKKLKPTGTIFLHCDWHANHRLRLLLDEVFGETNFINEIIWSYKTGGMSKRWLGRKHDTIYFYSKTSDYKFNLRKEKSYLQHKYGFSNVEIFEDDKGPYTLVGMRDCFDIAALRGNQPEVIGYKTQKPEELISRLIDISTDKGDTVLDCFSGGFTTAKVCADLNRKFICGDVSPVACKIGAKRLNQAKFYDYHLKGMPQTEEEFRAMDGHQFAESICEFMGWTCNPTKSNDKGIDGWDGNGNPVQIKNQKSKTGEKDLRNFLGTLIAAKKEFGIFVAWDFVEGRNGANEFVLKKPNGVTIELRTCRELIGDLLISNEKRAEIEDFYNKHEPESWKKNPKKSA